MAPLLPNYDPLVVNMVLGHLEIPLHFELSFAWFHVSLGNLLSNMQLWLWSA
jgi:hypothetical protein